MKKTILGRTGLEVSRTSFGVLPLQRVDFKTAKDILLKAYEGGINFYDTARGYSDSEEKIGYSLSHVRKDIYIATKASGAKNRKDVLSLLETSLKKLKTDYVDILQLHNPDHIPDPDDPESLYAGLLEAQRKGMTRFIGVTNHSRERAETYVASGLYDTLQFPLSAISDKEDFDLALSCKENNMGFIAMKAMCGGLLKRGDLAFAGLRAYENVVPIWGIQRMEELEEFLAHEANPPLLDDKMKEDIDQDRVELAGEFCRACGYCLPCAADIPIPMAARMGLLLRRMPSEQFASPDWQEKMGHVDDCIECGLCDTRCPYNLSPRNMVKKNYKEYKEWLSLR
jgi:aryl-alcohol dehydrogenase-like predicted oxidoreductase